jgi:hypothetical protein
MYSSSRDSLLLPPYPGKKGKQDDFAKFLLDFKSDFLALTTQPSFTPSEIRLLDSSGYINGVCNHAFIKNLEEKKFFTNFVTSLKDSFGANTPLQRTRLDQLESILFYDNSAYIKPLLEDLLRIQLLESYSIKLVGRDTSIEAIFSDIERHMAEKMDSLARDFNNWYTWFAAWKNEAATAPQEEHWIRRIFSSERVQHVETIKQALEKKTFTLNTNSLLQQYLGASKFFLYLAQNLGGNGIPFIQNFIPRITLGYCRAIVYAYLFSNSEFILGQTQNFYSFCQANATYSSRPDGWSRQSNMDIISALDYWESINSQQGFFYYSIRIAESLNFADAIGHALSLKMVNINNKKIVQFFDPNIGIYTFADFLAFRSWFVIYFDWIKKTMFGNQKLGVSYKQYQDVKSSIMVGVGKQKYSAEELLSRTNFFNNQQQALMPGGSVEELKIFTQKYVDKDFALQQPVQKLAFLRMT